MPFIANTDDDREAMLAQAGVSSFDELISDIPQQYRLREPLDLPGPASEMEVRRLLGELAAANRTAPDYVSFLGGGAYDHYIPAAVNTIVSRSEFYTAYTPYQAEVSQGTLQAIYEYQSMICRLYGMDVANASLYDGATAMAEAVSMAIAITGRSKVVTAGRLHPYTLDVLSTFIEAGDHARIVSSALSDGGCDTDDLEALMDDGVAAVIVQQPNFFGCLEDLERIGGIARSHGALFIVSADPVSLGVLRDPGSYGADIAVGEGQPLGNALNFGGPYLGIFAVSQKYVRKIPGRLVGMTRDRDGKDGFILTLQTREQHIRREKATSNICTNQALNALQAVVYLSLMGKQGLVDVASQSLRKAHYLAGKISGLPGYRLRYSRPFFREFVVDTPRPASEILPAMMEKGFFAGCDLAAFGENGLLVAVTEQRTREEMDRFTEALGSVSR
ncbi:aminomethyl-transferring glycine dehydrogenase subunit GcvPA [Prosthecochloris sp. HL-130-GSB]|uniref:aminomethyl-transferring glycine dehydrogenase subunit GcvPA n=1 Tax=Prosthecochloris sp. HL-130-GSB TaxID=1974213 RepID=UPI000A1C0FE3|nr:aminomethyl-transferring glycine dehydrogenase subunit GcvPA [Prosthecochloris sp. HL-130-GSB]ARM30398.1 glycine dehydrogenase (aminomethyl-transferring) [Prosthecochloris sp. HL-130-GSB]